MRSPFRKAPSGDAVNISSCAGKYIADAEGIGLDVLVGYDGIKDKRKIIDSMDYNKLRTGGGRYNSNISDEIIELNGLLDKIAQYRKELLIAIGNAI